MKNRKVNKAWLSDHINDPWVQRAQKDGYRARSAYKLIEIDEAFKLFSPGQTIVELGSTPGAWSQYVSTQLARDKNMPSTIIAVDLLPMQPIAGVDFILGDFLEENTLAILRKKVQHHAIDCIISDMAPNLSGHASTDAARIEYLIECALDFARVHLRPGGAMVAKVFHGVGYDNLVKQFRGLFKIVKPFKPKASRDRSAETYLVGLHRL